MGDGPDSAAAARRGDAPPAAPEAVEPADALADVWDLLDALPRAAAGPSMTATTIEMVAVEVERSAGSLAAVPNASARRGPAPPRPAGPTTRRLLGAAAVVAGSLLAGIVAGRATAPGIQRRGLERLPAVRNVELLREAGSVEFLEAVAERRFPPPRRPALPRLVADMRRFEAGLESLRAFRADAAADTGTLDARRAEVAAMTAAERRELERSAETFARLSGGEREDVVRLAEALGDPRRRDLIDAARLWHLWIVSCDPADRQDIIELGSRGRLEWLERQSRLDRRADDRPDGRPPRGWDRDRPPPDLDRDERRWPPPGPPRFGPPPFGPPRQDGFDGPPRPRRPPDRGPAAAPRDAAPSEEPSPAGTPAPPR
jgi:hypothetical protein